MPTAIEAQAVGTAGLTRGLSTLQINFLAGACAVAVLAAAVTFTGR